MILWLTLAQLGCGLLVATWLTPRSEVGDGLLRFLAVTAAVSLAPLAAAATAPAAGLALAATVVAGLGGLLLSWGGGGAGALLCRLAAVPAAVALGVTVQAYRRPGVDEALQSWLLPVDALTSAGLLGLTCGAMILGHFYLVNTDMPIAPLKRLSAAMIIVAVSKGMVLLAVLQVYGWPPSRAGALMTLLMPPGLFYVVRVAFGILGPLAMAPMIWGTVRIQSTQSATGILYAAVFLVLVGEMTANFLVTGTPFPF